MVPVMVTTSLMLVDMPGALTASALNAETRAAMYEVVALEFSELVRGNGGDLLVVIAVFFDIRNDPRNRPCEDICTQYKSQIIWP